eukprot:3520704-Prymnesium_polylepis.1
MDAFVRRQRRSASTTEQPSARAATPSRVRRGSVDGGTAGCGAASRQSTMMVRTLRILSMVLMPCRPGWGA